MEDFALPVLSCEETTPNTYIPIYRYYFVSLLPTFLFQMRSKLNQWQGGYNLQLQGLILKLLEKIMQGLIIQNRPSWAKEGSLSKGRLISLMNDGVEEANGILGIKRQTRVKRIQRGCCSLVCGGEFIELC